MNYRPFGDTGIMVSEIGVGCGGLGGADKAGLEPAIRRAFDLGVNLFDTADMYAGGASEETLGRVLGDLPRDRRTCGGAGRIDRDGGAVTAELVMGSVAGTNVVKLADHVVSIGIPADSR